MSVKNTLAKRQARQRYAKSDKGREASLRYQRSEHGKAYSRQYKLRREYGISQAEYDGLIEKQNGECAICHSALSDSPRRPHIDHEHDTGQIRGVLCFQCNTGLGNFKESIALLHWAADYLSGGKLKELWCKAA